MKQFLETNTNITITELKVQKQKWRQNLKKCIQEFKRVQGELEQVKAERDNSINKSIELKQRLRKANTRNKQRNQSLGNVMSMQQNKIDTFEKLIEKNAPEKKTIQELNIGKAEYNVVIEGKVTLKKLKENC